MSVAPSHVQSHSVARLSKRERYDIPLRNLYIGANRESDLLENEINDEEDGEDGEDKERVDLIF